MPTIPDRWSLVSNDLLLFQLRAELEGVVQGLPANGQYIAKLQKDGPGAVTHPKNLVSPEKEEKDYQEECSLCGAVPWLPFSLKPGQQQQITRPGKKFLCFESSNE